MDDRTMNDAAKENDRLEALEELNPEPLDELEMNGRRVKNATVATVATVKGGKDKAKKNRRHVVNRVDDLEARADALDEQVGALGSATVDLTNIGERAERERVDIRDRARKIRDRVNSLEEGVGRINADELPMLTKATAGDLEAIRDLVARVEFLELGFVARVRAWFWRVVVPPFCGGGE